MIPADLADVLERAFALRRPTFAAEAGLHDRIAAELADVHLQVLREFRLDARSRLDLFVRPAHSRPGTPGLAVEVKTAGGLPAISRQLLRYAEHAEVSGILLVTTRSAHKNLPEDLLGKPCHVLYIGGYLL